MSYRRQTGFTLVEVLVAMTLMSVLLVLLYSGLRIGARSWSIGEARAEQANELRIVQDFMRRQFRQSASVYYLDDTEGRVIAFQGENDTVRMVTPMLAYLGMGGLYWVEYSVVDDGDGRGLRLRWWPYRPEGNPRDVNENDVDEILLLRGIDDVVWQFFGSEETTVEEPEWQDSWDSPVQRPELIRLELQWQHGPWPPLVARLAGE